MPWNRPPPTMSSTSATTAQMPFSQSSYCGLSQNKGVSLQQQNPLPASLQGKF